MSSKEADRPAQERQKEMATVSQDLRTAMAATNECSAQGSLEPPFGVRNDSRAMDQPRAFASAEYASKHASGPNLEIPKGD